MTDNDEKPEETSTPDEGSEAGVDDLQAKLDEAEREREQFKRIAARAQADLVNYRRRAEAERDDIRDRARSALLLKVIGAVDDLDRALLMMPAANSGEWVTGIELVRRNIITMLDTEGVARLELLGDPYDPAVAEALNFVETEEGDEGTVTEVYREGYTYRDRVLRAAQVVVAKRPERANESEANDSTNNDSTNNDEGESGNGEDSRH